MISLVQDTRIEDGPQEMAQALVVSTVNVSDALSRPRTPV